MVYCTQAECVFRFSGLGKTAIRLTGSRVNSFCLLVAIVGDCAAGDRLALASLGGFGNFSGRYTSECSIEAIVLCKSPSEFGVACYNKTVLSVA